MIKQNNNIKYDFSQKLLRNIVEHLIAVKINNEVIAINP
jgi:hypothetical protein